MVKVACYGEMHSTVNNFFAKFLFIQVLIVIGGLLEFYQDSLGFLLLFVKGFRMFVECFLDISLKVCCGFPDISLKVW